jgi:type IV secretory pathway VirB10-like protein
MSMKQNFNNAFSKGAKGRTNFLVFGVLAVTIAAAAAFVSKKGAGASDASAQVMRAPDGANSVVDPSKASDAYLNTLKKSNEQEIANAQKNGTSAVATLTAKPVKTDAAPAQEQQATVIMANGQNGGLPNTPQFTQAQGGTMPMQGAQQQGMQQNKALSGQVAELLDTWKAPGQSVYSNRSESAAMAAAATAAGAAGAASGGGAPAAAVQADPVVLIPAGKILSAVIDTQTVSDDGGPVRATVVSGPYNGATLIGSMTVNRDMGRLNFHTMSFKGASVTISAVGMDPITGRVGMADEVDKHWFEKYGLVFVSSFVGGYGEAASSVGQTVTQTTGATIVQQDPLSPKMRAQVALGKSGSAISQQLAQDASAIKSTVTLNQSKALGVMFMKDVVSQ